MCRYTPCLKNVPQLYCYNFETWEWILIFFGRNVTDRTSNQKHITMPPQMTCASALPGKTEKHENCIFTQMLYQCVAWIQSAAWFLQSFWLVTHTHDAVWLPKSCNQCVQPAGLTRAWLRRKEVESATGVGLCCMHNTPVCYLLGFLFRKVMQKH